MKHKVIARALALASFTAVAVTPIAPASAQLAVIDVRAIAQQLKSVQQGLQQIEQLKAQVSNQQNMLRKLGSNISPELGDIVADATSVMKPATSTPSIPRI